MANCTRCGRELPAFSTGELSEVCSDCRQAAAAEAGAVGVPPITRKVWRPPVTTALLAVNFAVFVAMVVTGVSITEPSVPQLLRWGADWGPFSLSSQPWRMLTSTFVHIGIIHILLNMWCLWDLGKLSERIFDRWTFLTFYLVCGLAGSIGSLWWRPEVVSAGASGAVFGIAGLLIAVLKLANLPFPPHAMRGTLRSLLTFAGYNLFFGAVRRGTNNAAHIGGLLAGLILGAIVARHLTDRENLRRTRNLALIGAAVVLALAFYFVQSKNSFLVHFERSVEAFERGDAERTQQELDIALAAKPNDPLAILFRANRFLKQPNMPVNDATQTDGKRYVETLLDAAVKSSANFQWSRRILARQLQLDPNDENARLGLGVTLISLEENAAAIDTLQEAVRRNPQSDEAWYLLGVSYSRVDRSGDALQAFKKAAELKPDNEDYKRAVTEESQGRFK
jgi:membrane associated rhomboid family serine protease